MAESKRQSISGKIATPKIGPSKEVIDGDSILYKAVGARIKITCAPLNNVLEGTLFTTCNVTNSIAINTAPPPPNPSASLSSQPGDYHIIPFAHIVSFELIGSGERATESTPGFNGALPSISKVDLEAVRAREEHTIREMKKKDGQRGKDVPLEARDVFVALEKTLPTRWAEPNIVVNDAVLVVPPYSIESIKPATGKEQTAAQVRKILEHHFQRKKAGSGRTPVATPIAPRKGG